MDRANTINSLALAMGVISKEEYISRRFDNSTGTLYCQDDKAISDDIIKNAILYFEKMKQKYERSGIDNMGTVLSYYEAATYALKELQSAE
jgi:hypothetical protein